MAEPRSQSVKLQSLQTDVALLKQTTSTLEHTVIAQNAGLKAELAGMNTTLREIHDKLDQVNMEHAIELVRQKAELEAQAKELVRIESKITKVGAAMGALFLTILGGVLAWFQPSNIK